MIFNSKIFSWLLVLAWMAVIFSFSAQPASQSRDLSKGVTAIVIQWAEQLFPDTPIDIADVHGMMRKKAHVVIYFVLGVLVLRALYQSGVTGKKAFILALGICVLYAALDETHQYFVPGRGAQLSDVALDTLGSFLGINGYLLWRKTRKKT